MLPTTAVPHISQPFPLLLQNFDKMCVKSASYTPSDFGFSPLQRPIAQYINYGVINLDKTSGPSSHEIVSWVKRMIPGCEKTGHSGTLDPPVTGNLLICLNRATRLVKQQQEMGKKYVTILQFNDFAFFLKKIGKDELKKRCLSAIKTLTAPQLQKPPAEGCAVKCVLRLREIYHINFLECDLQNGRLLFTVDCESGTYIRSLCYHIGLLVGCESYMLELRRIRSGFLTEKTNMVTLHQVLDAVWLYQNFKDESYLRKVIMPLEFLLVKEKLIIVKDSAVAAICHGAAVLLQGVIRYSADINNGDRIVIITTKGEAVALATATMNAADIAGLNHGVAAQPTRVIMDREMYGKQWGKGPVATTRKKLIADGNLGKRGEVIEGKTPETYVNRHTNVVEFLKQAGDTCQNTLFDPNENIKKETNELKIIGENEQKEETKEKKKHKEDKEKKEGKKEEKEHKKHKDKKHM